MDQKTFQFIQLLSHNLGIVKPPRHSRHYDRSKANSRAVAALLPVRDRGLCSRADDAVRG